MQETQMNDLQEVTDSISVALKNYALPSPYAVFDYDNTLVENDLQQAFIAYICRHQLLRNTTLMHDPSLFERDKKAYHEAFFTHYYGLLAQGVTKDAFEFIIRGLVGFHVDEIEDLVEAIFLEQGTELGTEEYCGVTITKGFRLRNHIHEMIKTCRAKGIASYIISASPEVLVRAGLKHFGVEADGCVAVNLEVKDGILQDSVIEPIPAEEGKITCIQKYIHDYQPIVGFGDTMNDFNMLTYVQIPAVIDRGNQLTQIARENGWYIIKG